MEAGNTLFSVNAENTLCFPKIHWVIYKLLKVWMIYKLRLGSPTSR